MQNLAHKLNHLRERQTGEQIATAVFGTAAVLAQSLDIRNRVRIGVWPCVSQDAPELAMGLFTTLASLLERWHDVSVYRLFARLDGDPVAYQWTIQQSQFAVEDWELAALDENVAIWGQLEHSDNQWKLTVEIDNDLAEDESEPRSYTAGTIAGLVNLLPQAAADIAESIEADFAIFDAYAKTTVSDDTLRLLLTDLFKWQTNLFLSLWGVTWNTDTITNDLDKLIDAAQATGDEFGAWCIANAVAHAMSPGYGEIAQFVAPITATVLARFPNSVTPAMLLGYAQFRLGNPQSAYDILEAGLETNPIHLPLWLLLADLYRRGGRIANTIDTYQRAIEAGAVSADLYQDYAEFMNLLRDYNGDYLLIDPDDYELGDLTFWEAIEAYEAALKLTPDSVSLLRAQLLLLADVAEEEEEEKRLWAQFVRLVALDPDGEATRNVIDALAGREDIAPAIATLEQRHTSAPQRADVLVNLAAAQLIMDEGERAADLLEQAEALTDDSDLLADIDRLMLTAENQDFEVQLGEISGIVNSGTKLKSEQLDFLEDTIAAAPALAETYTLLAKARLVWNEPEEAMETLMDGLEEVPNDQDMIELLVQMLWDSGEKKLAFDYLNKGVTANPLSVPLLALTGRCLFENEQEDAAKLFLSRAEAIAPQHPALTQAREQIAQLIQKRKSP